MDAASFVGIGMLVIGALVAGIIVTLLHETFRSKHFHHSLARSRK